MWDLESMAIGWGKGAGKRGAKSTGLSTLLDMASEQLVGWPHKTSEIEKTAFWAVPSEHVRESGLREAWEEVLWESRNGYMSMS